MFQTACSHSLTRDCLQSRGSEMVVRFLHPTSPDVRRSAATSSQTPLRSYETPYQTGADEELGPHFGGGTGNTQNYHILEGGLVTLTQNYHILEGGLVTLTQNYHILEGGLVTLTQNYHILEGGLVTLTQNYHILEGGLVTLTQNYHILEGGLDGWSTARANVSLALVLQTMLDKEKKRFQ
uniref:Uncharacterized protein n=1 Tax=Timema cristinae TaxID=61476 RepID=A0A7R9CKE2_TIMCR|nr:unnamed protein product [Timema cristinae]